MLAPPIPEEGIRIAADFSGFLNIRGNVCFRARSPARRLSEGERNLSGDLEVAWRQFERDNFGELNCFSEMFLGNCFSEIVFRK